MHSKAAAWLSAQTTQITVLIDDGLVLGSLLIPQSNKKTPNTSYLGNHRALQITSSVTNFTLEDQSKHRDYFVTGLYHHKVSSVICQGLTADS